MRYDWQTLFRPIDQYEECWKRETIKTGVKSRYGRLGLVVKVLSKPLAKIQ